ncbi:hypothetical protein K1T35_48080 (plasmid) [Pseudonocardia sp. DSM 110487]|uniref:hypothetical protein n=1 Tax=Pseudonocardia sp. DSM 110487 TaxID=2865833 RepID=UPI001C69B422|nr:hypothetical protein [Pseudonocardia sp. DSM 110487]QYN41108.1 hypothetical protein K1T35_48080 [Pseudonocardia sp. DSM 110487]
MTGQEQLFEVELQRIVVDDPEDPVSWAAEWAPAGSVEATEDNTEDLADLVGAILRDVRDLAQQSGTPVRIEWLLVGDAPAGATVDAAVAAEGVTLPERVDP